MVANPTYAGQPFNPIQWHNPDSLRSELQLQLAQGDDKNATKTNALIATAEGRYDFQQPSLNYAFPEITPISFQDWFIAKWNIGC